jgi:heme A synthase
LLSLLLIVGLVVWARRAFPKGHTARLGAGLALFSVVVSSLIGAGLVLYRLVAGDTSVTRAVVMSAHLVNTLFLFAALALTALWGNGMPRLQLRGQGRLGTLFVASVIGMVALGVTGALSALGDTLYPASSLAEGIRQDFHPDASYLLQHRPLHPLTAMIVATLLIVTSLSAMARRASPATQFWGRASISFVIAQLIVGFTNLILLAPIWMQLIHLLVANLLWISFVMLGAHALKSQEEIAPQRAVSREKAGGKWPLKSPSLP